MKRKPIIPGLCAVLGLVGILALSGGKGRQPAPATHIPVITQDGKLKFVPNPAGYATMTLVVDLPRQATNSSALGTER